MKIITIEEQKQIQLDILSDVANFCERNGLRYYLAYGTLIGAIRHQGFIPWDDDIDIWMPEPDYDKFLASYHSDIYKVIHNGNTKNYYVNFAKVHDERTKFQETYSEENTYGVFVDIFPLHAYGGYSQQMRCRICLRMIRVKLSVWFKKKGLCKNIMNLIGKFILSVFSLKYISDYMEKVSREYEYENAEYLDTFTGDVKPYKKEWFEQWQYTTFEKHSFRIPFGYHEILKTQYGDYMQLPPEAERIPKHYAKVEWK